MTTPKVLIQLFNVNKIYQMDGIEIRALDDVNLSIKDKDFLAIVGPSGSGKSTLMHILGLLDKPTSGKVLVEGKDIVSFSENQLAKLRNQKLGFVFQFFNLLPRTTSLANVELTLVYSGVGKKEREKRSREMLEKLGLKDRLYHFPSQLSGGQQQRVAIARALINNPLLVIADEPTGNLDTKSGEEIIELLKKLNESGHTIIIVTHDLDMAKAAKKIIKLRDGKIIN